MQNYFLVAVGTLLENYYEYWRFYILTLPLVALVPPVPGASSASGAFGAFVDLWYLCGPLWIFWTFGTFGKLMINSEFDSQNCFNPLKEYLPQDWFVIKSRLWWHRYGIQTGKSLSPIICILAALIGPKTFSVFRWNI